MANVDNTSDKQITRASGQIEIGKGMKQSDCQKEKWRVFNTCVSFRYFLRELLTRKYIMNI